jgi:GxxExxY protein
VKNTRTRRRRKNKDGKKEQFTDLKMQVILRPYNSNQTGEVRNRKTRSILPADIELVGEKVLDAAFKIHTALGPGLLESVYEACMVYELRKCGLKVESQVALPVVYEEVKVDAGLRIDLMVNDCVIVELKSVEDMNPVYTAQLLTYLKLTNTRLGYLINFNVPHLKDGFKRLVN